MPAMGAVANDDLDEFAQWRSGSTGSPTKSTTIVGVDASSLSSPRHRQSPNSRQSVASASAKARSSSSARSASSSSPSASPAPSASTASFSVGVVHGVGPDRPGGSRELLRVRALAVAEARRLPLGEVVDEEGDEGLRLRVPADTQHAPRRRRVRGRDLVGHAPRKAVVVPGELVELLLRGPGRELGLGRDAELHVAGRAALLVGRGARRRRRLGRAVALAEAAQPSAPMSTAPASVATSSAPAAPGKYPRSRVSEADESDPADPRAGLLSGSWAAHIRCERFNITICS